MKTGLVMEGGSMRGLFTAGVIDTFMENGIEVDACIGVSAGATFGCNFVSKQHGRALRYNVKYCKNKNYGTVRSFLKTGNLFDKEFCYKTLPFELDIFDSETFKANPTDFYVVATDVETGSGVYYKCNDGLNKDLEYIRASASIPLVSEIVELDGHKMLDGGIADSVPLKFFQNIGYEKNIVILTQPDTYRKKKNKMTPLCKVVYKKYPKFVEAFENRHERYNACIEYIRGEEKKGKTFVIRPKQKLDLKSAEKDPEKLKAAYMEGRMAALSAIKNGGLKEFLSN